jgi:hypothetical protein
MAFRNQTIDQNKSGGRSEMSQGLDVGDSAIGTDGKVYDWTGERFALAGDQSRATNTEWLKENSKNKMIDEVTKIINDLEDKLNAIPNISFTQDELDNFLAKAIEQVKPYYDQRIADIEAGIKEGTIRNAEQMLKFMRDTQTEISGLLQKYDIDQARTEEEFINTLTDITASRDEDLGMKRDDWRNRLNDARMGLTQKGTLTSGIGMKQITDLLNRQQMEEESLVRRYGSKETEAETAKTYDLQQIALARQRAEADRLNKVGTPEQQAEAEAKLRETLGLTEGQALPTDLEMMQRQAGNNVTLYKQEDLVKLGEEQKLAIEAKRMGFEQGETDIREKEYEAQRRQILSDMAKKQRELDRLYA